MRFGPGPATAFITTSTLAGLSGPRQVVDAVRAAVTPRTRLVLLDHVTSPTGLVFPVAEIVRELSAQGIEILVDRAHAPGMLPVNLQALGATYYTANCHKWPCAPRSPGCQLRRHSARVAEEGTRRSRPASWHQS